MRALRKLPASTKVDAGMPGGVRPRGFRSSRPRRPGSPAPGRTPDARIRRASAARWSWWSARRRRPINSDSRLVVSASAPSNPPPPPPPAPDCRCAPVLRAQIPELQKRVDEEPEALLGRQTPGAGVRRVDEPELLQVLHHIANRGRGQRNRQHARQMPGADRFAGGEIGVDDVAENLPRTGVQVRQRARLGGVCCGGGHPKNGRNSAHAQGDDGSGIGD